MKHPSLFSVLAAAASFCFLEPAWGKEKAGGDAADADAFEQERLADFRAIYDHDGKLDIMIGRVENGVRHPVTFSLDELESFWKEQGKGKFVCITLAKADLGEKEQKKLVTKLADYFFKCGLKRVRIHQAQGFGTAVLYDSSKQG
ncbi:hypothetical protein [Prosthecobacter sp.]|uniref:hypothetical protein n=1 Tax=Prosthecobacter sp. TaxID=1965333 RepID=UPI00378525F8